MSASTSEGPNKQSKRPANTAFKQQRLKAWQPIITPLPVILTFTVLGVIFIVLGIVMLIASNEVKEHTVRYDNKCKLNETCTVTMKVDEKMKEPVFFYYRLGNYFQNHRRYVKSRNDGQLRGDKVTSYSSLEDCDPRRSKGDDKSSKNFYLPCGLIAWSMFNDTFELRDEADAVVTWKKDGIAWHSDLDKKFSNPAEDVPGIRVISDFEDEDFVVWMRTAGLPDFKKLYRRITHDVDKGTYTVKIVNNYPVGDFDGKKYVVLSTTTWVGGKNTFLGWAYIVVGILCLLQGIGFAILHVLYPRPLGDTSRLDWHK